MLNKHIPELNELADQALNRLLPDSEGKAIVTRGIVILEILKPGSEHRGVIAVDIGRQGSLPPWDVIALLEPIRIRAKAMMSHWMEEGWTEDDMG